MYKKIVIILLVVVNHCLSQINIQGVIRDSISGVPLSGAIVYLSQNKIIDTTNTDGIFQLNIPSKVIYKKINSRSSNSKLRFDNNNIYLYCNDSKKINVSIANLQGESIATLFNDNVNSTQEIIKSICFTPGCYLCNVQTDNYSECIKFIITNRGRLLFRLSINAILNTMMKTGLTQTTFVDTIGVLRVGYFQKTFPILNTTNSNLEIKCKKYSDSVKDVEGNIYHTVEIDRQTWLVENLKTTKYNDGTLIPMAASDRIQSPAFSWYNNDTTEKLSSYGALYNWYSVNTGKLAPLGWHVPSLEEWDSLTSHLGGVFLAGKKLKEAGQIHWLTNTDGSTNETGFTAIPSGFLQYNSFQRRNNMACFWTSDFDQKEIDRAWDEQIYTNDFHVKYWEHDKTMQLSVRCIKD